MTRVPRARQSYLVGRMELRRGWRAIRSKGLLQQGTLALAALFGAGFALLATGGAYLAGRAVVGGEFASPVEVASVVPAGLLVVVVAMSAYMTAIQMGDVDHRDGMLTTIPHRDLVGGLLVAAFVRIGGIFGAPLLVAAAGFAVGAGSPASVVLVATAVVVVTLAGTSAGFAVGLAARYVLSRSAFVARHKVALGTLAFAAYVGLLLTNSIGDVAAPAVGAASESPVGWFADLALLALAEDADPLRAAGAVGLGVVLGLAGLAAAVRVAESLWYADPVASAESRRSAGASGAPVERSPGWLDRALDRPTAWTTRVAWLRARRAPLKVVYVAYPLFALFGPVQQSIQAGQVVSTVPPLVALYGAWATGALFTLNPLGDQGAVLPVSVTSGIDGRQFLAGHVLAGVLVGAPVTVALVVATGLLSPFGPATTATTALAALALCVGATTLAAAVGTAYPKFEATSVTRSREVVMPSAWAFLGYSVVLLLLGAPATVATVPPVADAAGDAAGVPAGWVAVAGLGATVALVAGVAHVGARYAEERFDRFELS